MIPDYNISTPPPGKGSAPSAETFRGPRRRKNPSRRAQTCPGRRQRRKEIEIQVTPDGRIVGVSKTVAEKNLPKAIARTLANPAGDARIREVEDD